MLQTVSIVFADVPMFGDRVKDSHRGWSFVAAQAVLLIALVLLPGRDDWPTPTWFRLVGSLVFLAGVVVLAMASLNLGRALTPTPVPSPHGRLTTAGLYRFVRHPIYTGVLAIVVGITLRSGSVFTLAMATTTIAFFSVKARWEEGQLMKAYRDYAASTPRFVPFATPPRRRN
jgi:protein-S-isoprenylcysteine O-methyltransferase Ste14